MFYFRVVALAVIDYHILPSKSVFMPVLVGSVLGVFTFKHYRNFVLVLSAETL